MKLQTPVTDLPCKVGISYSDKITMLGSCFSDNIGSQLADLGFDICVNPFGTLYNPVSIMNSVERLLSHTPFTSNECIQIGAGDNRFCSFSHHTSFAREDREVFLDNANMALKEAARHFAQSGKVVITLGTSWCFRHVDTDRIVSNCLKRPASEFVRERLSAGDTASYLEKIMDLCRHAAESTPGFQPKEFIFTVSPIRHFKDGAHGNQISKAGLLLGIEEAIERSCRSKADYFPSYEIMMDELRDYRFYSEDMCHPTKQTVDYIRERFLSWALSPSEFPVLEENMRKLRQSRHISQL